MLMSPRTWLLPERQCPMFNFVSFYLCSIWTSVYWLLVYYWILGEISSGTFYSKHDHIIILARCISRKFKITKSRSVQQDGRQGTASIWPLRDLAHAPSSKMPGCVICLAMAWSPCIVYATMRTHEGRRQNVRCTQCYRTYVVARLTRSHFRDLSPSFGKLCASKIV